MKIQKVKAPAKMAARSSLSHETLRVWKVPGYNHAIRNVSDLESRYFVFSMQCAISPRPALILLEKL